MKLTNSYNSSKNCSSGNKRFVYTLLTSTCFLMLVPLFIVCACSKEPTDSKTDGQAVRFIGEQQIDFSIPFKNTIVGGISGIDMGPNETFYLISDDAGEINPSRFYTAVLNYDSQSFYSVTFTDVINMKTQAKTIFPSINSLSGPEQKEIANAESIRYNAETNSLFWTSEGLNSAALSYAIQPFIRQMSLNGDYISEVPTPEQFRYNRQSEDYGLRANATFEGLCLIPESNELLTVTEAPLIQDGLRPNFTRSGAPVRIARINWKTNQQIAQYAYISDKTPIEPIPGSASSNNGVSEILAIDANRFLVLERSFSAGHPTSEGNSIRLYEIDLSKATPIDGSLSLATTSFTPVSKTLVLDFSQIGKTKIDNVEGMCWGKTLANGHRSLVFVTDNNFSTNQLFQIFVFEVSSL